MRGGLPRLVRDTRGVAMIEMAIGLPVLLIAGLGGLEVSNLVLAHMKVSRIASMTADNASRVRDSIDESDIVELFTGAQLASGSLDLRSNGRIILSDLQQNDAKTGQWIRWQRCYGNKGVNSSYGVQGAGQNNASLQSMSVTGPPARSIAAATGTSVMFVELQYDYRPIISGVYGGFNQTIKYVSAFNVRKRPNGDPTNTTALTDSQRNLCSASP